MEGGELQSRRRPGTERHDGKKQGLEPRLALPRGGSDVAALKLLDAMGSGLGRAASRVDFSSATDMGQDAKAEGGPHAGRSQCFSESEGP